eukprot:TRINITY_DN5437_c0_g1_i1.p1 TRINITY_DN5437_c0_g1~~TRINITY_DN5437_c0_g1_i1.p1  ORF type:complete len:137 (-),score=43.04 TRINITY_DN5437_c0_g1_i1:728-1138(-)
MVKKGGNKAKAAATDVQDAPWRKGVKTQAVLNISRNVVLKVRQGPNFQYAMSILKHPDPVGMGLAQEAFLEAAGDDCIIPGLQRPVRILGLQVWPLGLLDVFGTSQKVFSPMGKELKTVGKLLDRAFDLMQAPFER